MQEIVDQMVASQGHTMMKAQTRRHLGRFASALAAKRQDTKPTRPASVAPTKTRTFDEIAEMTEQELPRQKLPFGAGLQKQRTSSEGDARLRFRGQLVK